MADLTATQPGDAAQAEALRIADEWLKRMGWKYTPADIGKRAREILDGMTPPEGRLALKEGSAV